MDKSKSKRLAMNIFEGFAARKSKKPRKFLKKPKQKHFWYYDINDNDYHMCRSVQLKEATIHVHRFDNKHFKFNDEIPFSDLVAESPKAATSQSSNQLMAGIRPEPEFVDLQTSALYKLLVEPEDIITDLSDVDLIEETQTTDEVEVDHEVVIVDVTPEDVQETAETTDTTESIQSPVNFDDIIAYDPNVSLESSHSTQAVTDCQESQQQQQRSQAMVNYGSTQLRPTIRITQLPGDRLSASRSPDMSYLPNENARIIPQHINIPPNIVVRKINEAVKYPLLTRPWLSQHNFDSKSTYHSMKMLSEKALLDVFKCMGSNCSFHTAAMIDFIAHQEQHLKDDREDLPNFRKCSYCLYTADLPVNLAQHIAIVHENQKISCSRCFFRCSLAGDLRDHFMAYHP